MHPEYYNKPDRCPKCGASNVERKNTAPSNMEYDMGRTWYECHSCNFTEDVTIEWAGGSGVPESDWWSLTKYPISYWQNLIDLNLGIISEHEESIESCERNIHVAKMKLLELDVVK
jgi:transposase-like protein